MCTARFNGHLYREVCVQGGGVSRVGVCVREGVSSWVVCVQGMYLQGSVYPLDPEADPPL